MPDNIHTTWHYHSPSAEIRLSTLHDNDLLKGAFFRERRERSLLIIRNARASITTIRHTCHVQGWFPRYDSYSPAEPVGAQAPPASSAGAAPPRNVPCDNARSPEDPASWPCERGRRAPPAVCWLVSGWLVRDFDEPRAGQPARKRKMAIQTDTSPTPLTCKYRAKSFSWHGVARDHCINSMQE